MERRAPGRVLDFPGTAVYVPRSLAVANVIEQDVQWLSHGRLAAGKITVLDGDPGLGKSTLMLEYAARISRGDALPGGESPAGPRGVLILSAEDGEGDTIRPRLRVAGADLRRTYLFKLLDEEGRDTPPSIPEHLDLIEQQIGATDAALVIIDPLMAYLSAMTNANRDQDVRRALSPLGSVAERTGAAIIVLRHLNKAAGMSSLYRGGGSIGIIGAARFGLLVAKDPDDQAGQRRILACQKCNIGPEPPSLAYRLEGVAGTDVARVVWEGESHHRAGQLTEAPRTESERSGVQEAKSWLLDRLSEGAVPVKDLQRQARDDGIGWRTVEAAKSAVGVQWGRKGFGKDGQYRWWLPIALGGKTTHAPHAPHSYSATAKPASDQEISHAPQSPQQSVGVWDDET